MTWTQLASTTSTSATTINIENIDNFKYVVVAVKSTSQNIFTSALIPIDSFKNHTTGYWAVTSGGNIGYAKYISNNSVSMYGTTNYTIILYGVK